MALLSGGKISTVWTYPEIPTQPTAHPLTMKSMAVDYGLSTGPQTSDQSPSGPIVAGMSYASRGDLPGPWLCSEDVDLKPRATLPTGHMWLVLPSPALSR